MSFRFWRRVKILPGVTLNLSKSGGSLSLGGRGAKVTIGPRGRRATLGIPGTGIFYTKTYRSGRGSGAGGEAPAAPGARAEDKLTLGFFRRLTTPRDEEDLVDGLRELAIGSGDKALEFLRKAAHLGDGAFCAGYVALLNNDLKAAQGFFTSALDNYRDLGKYFRKYGVEATMTLAVTGEVAAEIRPSLRGVLLCLVEVYQREGMVEEAVSCLKRLRRLEPEDVVVKVSLAELLTERGDRKSLKDAARLAEGVENSSPVHTALLLYKARALKGLGLLDAARDVLTPLLRRKKGRSRELLLAVRYERALTCEALGQKARARKDLEKIFAESQDYEDVAERLGL